MRSLFRDPEESSIVDFIKEISSKTEDGAMVLDAGAGSRPYRQFFKHCVYESCDYEETIVNGRESHDFYCSLDDIPQPDNKYDLIMCTQVLEHVKNPNKAMKELTRVLKDGGKIAITVPQSYPIHEAPHNYFNFLKFGLRLIVEEAGLQVILLEERGGAFLQLIKMLEIIPSDMRRHHKENRSGILTMTMVTPIYLFLKLNAKLLLPLAWVFDSFDGNKNLTLGYKCLAVKKQTN